MSTPGWYPDPSGAPGRYRYWDGRGWSQQTTARPRASPTAGRGRRRALPLILGLLALAVVMGLIIAFVVRQAGPGTRQITNDPVPTSTVSGWDDSSPTAAPSPSVTPDPSGSASTRPLTSCPVGDPRARADHPRDDRVRGGGLSFPRVPGWQDDLQSSGVSWGYDVASQGHRVAPTWLTLIAVGEIRAADGFTEPKQAAQSVMQCVASSQWYRTLVSTKDVTSEATTVDGHQAWRIRTDIHVDERTVEGDTVEVIVVDTGRPDALGLFVGAVAIDHADLLAILDDTTRGLTVD